MPTMLYVTPTPTESTLRALAELDDLRKKLHDEVATPGRWMGALRREVRANSIESSVSIEGFTVGPGEAASIVAGKAEAEADDKDQQAVACYARAMDHVGAMAVDPNFRWSDRVILDLHFDACLFQRDRSPGLWRTGPISVTAEGGSRLAYVAPEGDDVVPLMTEVSAWLQGGDLEAHPVVRGAMAHLHVVSVHPFRDGNGRVSRITQSLVLARERIVSPEFGSIEDYLSRHTPEYYETLQQVQRGSYQPDRDATPWVEFCIRAHIEQAGSRLAEMDAAAIRWTLLEEIAESHSWPDRLVIAMERSLTRGTDRRTYSSEAGVSLQTATGDLRRLQDAGLLRQEGGGRATRYIASQELQDRTDNSRPN